MLREFDMFNCTGECTPKYATSYLLFSELQTEIFNFIEKDAARSL